MFMYMFVISKDHNFMFLCTLMSLRLCISFSVLCVLNALGNCNILFSSFARYVATLFHGLIVQLTIGLISLFSLRNFIFNCIRGALVFIFPFIRISYYVIACINGCCNGFLLFFSLILCYFFEIVCCYEFVYFFYYIRINT
jgi:hypothetical protein